MDRTMKKYEIYRDELLPVRGAAPDEGRKRLNFRESVDEIATGITVIAGAQGHDDRPLVAATIKLMQEPLRDFVTNSHEFGGWVNECRKRIDEIRRSLS